MLLVVCSHFFSYFINQIVLRKTSKMMLSLVSTMALLGAGSAKVIELTSLNIDSDSVTVGGLSAGGFMAVQMHVAYSDTIHGSAIFAGGPFFCAMDNLMIAEQYCMYDFAGNEPKLDAIIQYTDAKVKTGDIDDTENLKDDKVYMFSGKKDTTVSPKTMHSLEDYYNHYGLTEISSEFELNAAHCLPTLDFGEKCDIAMSPYIGKCDYDGAGLAFKQLYGDLVEGEVVNSNLYEFNQKPFYTGNATSLDTTGYIYIPSACEDGSVACKLHMNFHGCKQGQDFIRDEYAIDTGFNGWAEANNIVVVYPYAVKNLAEGNGNGCFDWWGYTDENYALKSGVQMAFAKSIIDTLKGV